MRREYENDHWISHTLYGGSKKEEFKAPTRKEMLAKIDEFVTKTTAELNEARQLKTDCEQQKRTLQQEQQTAPRPPRRCEARCERRL